MFSGDPIGGAPISSTDASLSINYAQFQTNRLWRGGEQFDTILQTYWKDADGNPKTYVDAERDLIDPGAAFGGPASGRVISWGRYDISLSDRTGQLQGATLSLVEADNDRRIRDALTNSLQGGLLTAQQVIRAIFESDRLNGSVVPQVIYRGLVSSVAGKAGYQIQMAGVDWLSNRISLNVPLNLVGVSFKGAPSPSLTRYAPILYGRLSDQADDGTTTQMSWGNPIALAMDTDFTQTTDGLIVVFNIGGDSTGSVTGVGANVNINGVTKAATSQTQSQCIGVPYATGQTGHVDTSALPGGVIGWFFPLFGDTWAAPISITLDADFTETNHGMVLMYNTNNQGGTYALAGTIYAEVDDSHIASSANVPYQAGKTAHITTVGGTGLVATFYGFTSSSTVWADPAVVTIDTARDGSAAFTKPAAGVISLYNSGNEQGWVTLSGVNYGQVNEVYHMAVGIPYPATAVADVQPYGGSGLLAWYWALTNGSSGTGVAPKGTIPLFSVGGPWGDALGEAWDIALLVCGHAVKGNFTLYSRDSNNVVTPLASLDDTQISAPGRTGFATRWGTTYRVVGGLPFTLVYARGDLATSITSGNVSIYANLDAIENIGDGSGVLLTQIEDQIAHFLDNYVLPDTPYTSGNWAGGPPLWLDGVARRDLNSFTQYAISAEATFSSDGGDRTTAWAITQITTITQQLQYLMGLSDGLYAFTKGGQFRLVLDFPNVAPPQSKATLTEESELIEDSFEFSINSQQAFFWNTVTVNADPQWDANGSESFKTSFIKTDDISVGVYKLQQNPNTLDFHGMITAARRDELVSRRVARGRVPTIISTGATGLNGLAFDVGDYIEASHRESPWVAGGVRSLLVRKYSPDPDSQKVFVEGYYVPPLLTTMIVDDKTIEYEDLDQMLVTTAEVTGTGGLLPSEGTVTFTIKTMGGSTVGTPTTSGTLLLGDADANYTIPGGTGA